MAQFQEKLNTPPPAPRSSIRWILVGLTVLFLAAAQVRIIHATLGSKLAGNIQASEGVADGLPHWRIFQSRVLGPYMVRAASSTGLPVGQAYTLMMFVWLAVFFSVLVAAAADIWRSSLAAVAIAGSAALLNALLMQDEWLYPWDFIDLTIFTAVTWAVLRNRSLWIVVGIIAVEIFNRETATIMAGWLALDGLLGLFRRNRFSGETTSPARQIVVAVALALVSQAVIETLRAMLLVREVGNEIFREVAGPGTFLGFKLGFNIYELKRWLLTQPNLMLPYGMLVGAIPIACAFGLMSRDRGAARISLLFLMLWTFTLLFGVVYETRVWLAFVPFLVLAVPRMKLRRAPSGE